MTSREKEILEAKLASWERAPKGKIGAFIFAEQYTPGLEAKDREYCKFMARTYRSLIKAG